MKAAIPALILGMIFLLFGCGTEEEVTPPPPVGAGVYEITTSGIQQQWRVLGRTKAVESVEIHARVEAEVVEVLFNRGRKVNAGDPLFRLDNEQYVEQLRRAQAQVDSRRSALTLAQTNLNRGLELQPRGYLSTADLDLLRNNAEQAQAALADAEAALRQNELNLEYTVITTPISGRAGNTQITAGDLVRPGSGRLVTVIAPDPIRVEFQLTDREFANLLAWQRRDRGAADFKVFLKSEDKERHPFEGRVDFIDIEIQEGTGTVTATAEFPNPDETLVPGFVVNLIFERTETLQGLLLPEQALQRNQLGPFVMWVNEENNHQVEIRQISLGDRHGTSWEIKEGLSAGDLVVVEGLQKIRSGAKIQPSLYARDPETGLLAPVDLMSNE